MTRNPDRVLVCTTFGPRVMHLSHQEKRRGHNAPATAFE